MNFATYIPPKRVTDSTWKDVQHDLLLEKWKSESQWNITIHISKGLKLKIIAIPVIA